MERLIEVGYKFKTLGDYPELEYICQKYKEGIHTPELLHTAWQQAWNFWTDGTGLRVEVPSLNASQKDLIRLWNQVYLEDVVFVPPDIDLDHIIRIFPQSKETIIKLRQYSPNEIHDKQQVGWMNTEMSIDAPYVDNDQSQLEEIWRISRRKGLALAPYIVCSEFLALFIDHRLDERWTHSRLLGSSVNGMPLVATYYACGRLSVHPLPSQIKHPYLGGRSVEQI